MSRPLRVWRPGYTLRPSLSVLRGLEAACHVAMAQFEAASDGTGDVSKADARRIEAALTWLTQLRRQS